MIYLFTGSDVNRVRTKAFQWVAAARKKAPNVAYIRLNADEIAPATLEEATGTQGLFLLKSLVMLDDPFAKLESAELVVEYLSKLKESENVIAILAPKLIPARLKKLEGVAEKVFVEDLKEKKAARGFNSALVNALGAKDGKGLWKEIVKASREGDVPEMVHGLLHWKARDMMQKGSRSWTPEEARVLSRELIEMVSDARSGNLPLGPALERFALSLDAQRSGALHF